MRPVAIDLFAGAGGMSLGFEQAGFDVVAAVEIDPVHACVHHFNFPACRVIAKSASEIRGDDIRRMAGIEGKVDLVFGGAPCQGFSLIGKRAMDDPRNSLVKDFVRLVRELDADYFVFENVKGLTIGGHRAFLDELIRIFESAGYRIRLPWSVLNAAHHGVPQDRQRLFLLGAKAALPTPLYPNPTTVHPNVRGPQDSEIFLSRGPTCRDALGDLPDAEQFASLLRSDEVSTISRAEPSAYACELRCLEPSAWHHGLRRDWNPNILTSSARSDHTPESRKRFTETEPGTIEPVSRFYKLHPDGISNTLRAGTDSARGAFTSPRPIHYRYPRCITVREMARLHGFPDWFRFHRTKWHGARQIGNSVPPPLARAVAGRVLEAMGIKPKSCPDVLSLGDPALLGFDMSQAAAYWNVPVPVAGRVRGINAEGVDSNRTKRKVWA